MGSSMAEWDWVGKEIFPSSHKIKKPARYGRSVHGEALQNVLTTPGSDVLGTVLPFGSQRQSTLLGWLV